MHIKESGLREVYTIGETKYAYIYMKERKLNASTNG